MIGYSYSLQSNICRNSKCLFYMIYLSYLSTFFIVCQVGNRQTIFIILLCQQKNYFYANTLNIPFFRIALLNSVINTNLHLEPFYSANQSSKLIVYLLHKPRILWNNKKQHSTALIFNQSSAPQNPNTFGYFLPKVFKTKPFCNLKVQVSYVCFIIVQFQMEGQKYYGNINDICVVGHGSIGKAIIPLIRKHFTFDKMTIIDPHPVFEPKVSQDVCFMRVGLTKDNYSQILDKIFINKVGFCVNLSVGTSSSQITQYCQAKGVFYIDTVKEEWEGYYSNESMALGERSNYAIREALLRDVRKNNSKTTAISCCGANPGMVSWLVKQALVNLAKDTSYSLEKQPTNRKQWGLLMKNLGVKGIHIAERDTQKSNEIKTSKQFWNTWSVDGFISQGFHQPSELGWGTHQKWVPTNAVFHREGCQAAIYLTKPGMDVAVKSWCPTLGPQTGFLVTHDEAISISDFFTVKENDQVVYRPTCHYAYHPSPDAFESVAELMRSKQVPNQNDWKVLESQIVSGMDELGVLLYGHSKNAYWYGSQLDIQSARKRAPDQNATALQVTSAVIAGMVWALKNPQAGLVQADQMDYKQCLQVQQQYISPVRGYYTDWNPLTNEKNEENSLDLDLEDPWGFKNILINK